MDDRKNLEILLKQRPVGEPRASDFEVARRPVPEPREGEFLRRTIYLSLDPYMRGRMNDVKSYVPPAALGAPMPGGTVSEVIASRNPKFKEGDIVLGYDGWRSHACDTGEASAAAGAVFKLDPKAMKISHALGVLGMPGHTAYAALERIGRPKPGETLVVSAASGAVGSVVGQIAKIKGCRTVGIVGSDDKAHHCMRELGFDACVNRRSGDLRRALREACPKGVDIYYDNVGGEVLETVLRMMNIGGRVPLVGLIADYNATEPRPGPNLFPVLVNRLLIQGFIVFDHNDLFGDFQREVGAWVREGRIRYREDIVDGLENAPRAFMGLLQGANFGKLLVRVSEDPTA
ncbi:MAG: NADP-dependent oxidoreductase [Myxococcales bacterium]|nr:NADP-dependent oxidoreductase [Myxococcales bacterium]